MKERAPAPRVNILGVGVSAVSLYQATRLIVDGLAGGARGYVTVTGVHGVTEAQTDPKFRTILNEAWMTTPDGMPLSWIGRSQGFGSMDRVYGPDLMLQVFAATQDGSVRHFFYGGNDGVAEDLKSAMENRFPGVNVCGTLTPPFRPLTDEEEYGLSESVRACRPDLLWIGLSTPKQERFMASHLGKLDVQMMVGVGAAFDFHTGRVSQAPYWMQMAGLEWLYRLCHEPRRLGRRYLVNNPLFIVRMIGQYCGFQRQLPFN